MSMSKFGGEGGQFARFVENAAGLLRIKARIDPVDYQEKLDAKEQNPDGSENPDPTPMAPPIGYNRQPTMIEHIRNMVRSEELRRAAAAAGAESFDEADDFEVEDDPFPVSSFEAPDDLEPVKSLREKAAKEEDAPVPPAKGKKPKADAVAESDEAAEPQTDAD